MSRIIGIDLGTTNSVCAIMEGSDPKVIPNQEGERTTPSVTALTKEGEFLVGRPARNQAVTNPKNTIYSVKRFIGSKYSERKTEAEKMPYSVTKDGQDRIFMEVQDQKLTPPEISAKVLSKMKLAAEDYLGAPVTKAVITVPAYFNDSQRQATKDAGRIAGLEVLRIINEPTAAALAYGLDKKQNKKIAVYDFGGGTFDISILDVGDNVVEVLSTNGDTHLGGDNIDEILIEFLVKEFKKDTGIDVTNDPMAMQRLKEAAEKSKIELSSKNQVDINLPYLTANETGPKHLNLKLMRSDFERMIDSIVEKTLDPCRLALKDSGLNTSEIDEVLLVGGSTRIPLVGQAVKNFFQKDPSRGVNPDEVVALGAAVQAGVLSGDVKDILLLDVTPLSLGIETLGGVFTRLIERNSTIPKKASQVFSTAADNQTSVDIVVYQGEREIAKENRLLGRFALTDIPSAPRGTPQIEVTFDIDANGILNVSAKDLGTGKEQKITVTNSSGLSENEISQMVSEAEKHAQEDKNRKEIIDAKNQLDSLILQTEKTLSSGKEKMKADVTEALEKELENAKVTFETKSEDGEALKHTFNQLQEKATAFATELYQNQANQPNEEASSQASEKAKEKDNVVDAEFEQK